LLAAAVALGSLLGICATNALASATPPPSTPAAVAYQLNAGHTGVTADSVAASPTKRWSDVFPGGVSYPLIVGSRVYVTVAHASTYGTTLYALQAGTGAKLWSVNLGGTYYWSGLTYAAGRVFTVNYDGVMEAFDAVTGATDWSTQLPDQYAFSSPPTAANGYVYTGGAGEGGTAYAVDQANGVVKWTAPVENGDNSSPAVSASGVYVSYACGQSYDFDPSSGAQIWHRSTACEGGGGKTPVLADGFLFVRDLAYPGVLNASTGAMVAQFTTSGPAPAVDSSQIYDLSDSTLNREESQLRRPCVELHRRRHPRLGAARRRRDGNHRRWLRRALRALERYRSGELVDQRRRRDSGPRRAGCVTGGAGWCGVSG